MCRLQATAMPFFLVLFLSHVVLSLDSSWQNEIFVDGENGTDSESCLQGGILSPCATVNMALKGLRKNSTVIYVNPGTYTLEHGIETSIIGKHHVAIIGRNEKPLINCNASAGLAFSSSRNIRIESINFQYCGKDYMEDLFSDYYYYETINIGVRAAVYIKDCRNVTLNYVTIKFSNGTGLLLINLQGIMTLENSTISDSNAAVVSSSYEVSLIGGGILLFDDNYWEEETYYFVRRCTIISNNFKRYVRPHLNDLTCCLRDMGGGIIIMNSYSSIQVDSCTIAYNSRGIFICESYGPITIQNTTIHSNFNYSIVTMFDDESLNLYDVNLTDDLIFTFDSMEDFTVQSYPNQYTVNYDSFQIDVVFSNSSRYDNFPIKFKKRDCSYSYDNRKWGRCLDEVTYKTQQCPVPYSYCDYTGCHCAFNHADRLCGRCEHGYSVTINSNYLSCVRCDKPGTVAKGWAALIGLELVPVTVMVAVIAILNVNLNQGSLNAYILFCQILTMSFPSVSYPAWLISNYDNGFRFSDMSLIPLSIWNLDFINIPSFFFDYIYDYSAADFSICISKSTTPLGALSFWYVIAFYPLVLLMLFYGCIILYYKGYRCVVCVVRPVHRILARFWRMFDIQPSLTHTVASVYTLCFTQLAATSFKILHPTWYEDKSGKNHTVFFYDGTQPYFKGWHGLAGTVAVLVLVLLISTTIYLLIYPVMCFQKCLNKIKFKKDFLISLTDVFTGPYKDGTQQNSWDYRYFAGIHFALRLVVMVFYYIPQNNITKIVMAGLEAALCVFFASTIIIFRPYKRNIHTFNEMILLMVLAVFSSCYIYPIPVLDFYFFIFLVLPVSGFIVVMVVTPYCVLWMMRKCRCGCRYRSASNLRSVQHNDGHDAVELVNQQGDEEFSADRLMNPERYDEHHVSGVSGDVNDTFHTPIKRKNATASYNTFCDNEH